MQSQARFLDRCVVGAVALLLTLVPAFPAVSQELPQVPGFQVEIYAVVPKPVILAFDPSGVLYAGNAQSDFSPVKIHRIEVGGSPVSDYGAGILDPDGVVVDVAGSIAGVPGSVLVASGQGGGGSIWAIWPDETTAVVFGPTSVFLNPAEMLFDDDGRFLVSDINGSKKQVLVSEGEFPQPLFTQDGAPHNFAIHPVDGAIFTTDSTGTIRIHAADGTVVADPFVILDGTGPVEFGPGGVAWGSDLLTMADTELVRIDSEGKTEWMGSGFAPDSAKDLKFGPDGAAYVSEQIYDRILRITPLCSADVNLDGSVDVADLALVVLSWGECPQPPALCFDINSDGVVDVEDLVAVVLGWGSCP